MIIVNNLPFGSAESDICNQKELNESVKSLNQNSNFIKFHTLSAFDLPPEQLGAGLARKIGMDIAADRYFDSDESVQLIVGLDADCFVEKNYLIEIYQFFKKTKANGASIYFEHPLSGDLPDVNYLAITSYELHLRYYNLMMRYIGFPQAFHTVGSSFAVSADAYVKAGGMTKKIAGEDFYFIHKVLAVSGFYGDILTTTVYPSARISSRVLFGTGAAVSKFVLNNDSTYLTFNPEAILLLKPLFLLIDDLWTQEFELWSNYLSRLDHHLIKFLTQEGLILELNKLKTNCSSLSQFQKRFFFTINALVIVRFLNYLHESLYTKSSVLDASVFYLQLINYTDYPLNERALLELFRSIERNL